MGVKVPHWVTALAWTGRTETSRSLIGIGTNSGIVRLLQVVQKDGYTQENPAIEVSWVFASDQGVYLNVSGARIEGVTGLNPTNLELLKQRGAIGEPVVSRVQEVEGQT